MGSSTENSALKTTRNPWDLETVPGGSSGGSAAAVAARLCPISLGSDTGGSIRQPAAFCGVVGYKPTYGRVSRYGLVAFGSSLDQIGPLATSTTDIALTMEVLGQHCPHDSTSIPKPAEDFVKHLRTDLKGVTVGVPIAFLSDLNASAQKHFDASLDTMKSLGATVVDVDLSLMKYSVAMYYILATAEASTNLARFDGIRYGRRSEAAQTLEEVYDLSKQDGFGHEVKNRILLGTFVLSSGYQDAYYKQAQKVRSLMIKQYREAFDHCDVIAMPVTPIPAFKAGEIQEPLQMYLQDVYTISANLAGIPAISIPATFDDNGKPIGFQLQGPQLADAKLVGIAHAFEKATSAATKIPNAYEQ